MEFDEEQEEQEIGVATENYQTTGNNSVREGVSPTIVRKSNVRYRECLKNHAVGIGGHALDGCGEFMPAGEEGIMDALKCAACNCHRNFHRKEAEGEVFHHTPPPHLTHHHQSHHHQFSPFSSYRTPHHPSGYLHVNPPPLQRPLALPSTSRDDEDMSNPSSSGGGGGTGGSRKRFRTKFTADQKDKMLAFAERLGWRMQKQDEALVQQFCAETNIKRHVFKVWMHNNKHTLGKKP
ncbi:unnamed protein product [Withania somnifera]